MMLLQFLGVVAFLTAASIAAQPSVFIVIRSQPNSYSIMKAEALKNDIEAQVKKVEAEVAVVMAHKEWSNEFESAYAILPLLPKLAESSAGKEWVMFVEEATVVDVAKLIRVLSNFDSEKDYLLARGLYDTEMVIIHHFARRKAKSGGPFLYPDFESGWVLSTALLNKAAVKWSESSHSGDFLIDLKHEVAVYMADEFGIEITEIPEFCGAGEESPKCATNVIKDLPVCDDQTTIDDVFVGVKTTLMFHKDRVKVVMDTWGPKVKHLILYSNVTDPSIPTIDCGVENTVRGHCGKTDAILKDFLERSKTKNYKWLVIADDDTIMSISRLVQFLNCYDHTEVAHIGEKYGYALATPYGYGYITGGGGMIFSKPAVEMWVNNCGCPSIDTPDDMILGSCFLGNKVHCIHSPLFHQARPEDYSEKYLSNQTPISFHKHWQVDPLIVYKTWFEKADKELPTFDHTAPKPTVTTTASPYVVPTPLPPTPLKNPRKDEL